MSDANSALAPHKRLNFARWIGDPQRISKACPADDSDDQPIDAHSRRRLLFGGAAMLTATMTAQTMAASAPADATVPSVTAASIGAVRVVNFGRKPGTSRGGSTGTVLWVGAAGVTPTHTRSGDIVINAAHD